jgi:hypothetical protein
MHNTLSELDLRLWRERVLWPKRKPSKAERYFDDLMSGKDSHKVARKDYDIIMGLYNTYWDLQNQIMDETNSDGQMQRAYIDQQNDIADEIERVYIKYYNNGKANNT